MTGNRTLQAKGQFVLHVFLDLVEQRKALPLLIDPGLRQLDAERFSVLFSLKLLAGDFQHAGVSINTRRYVDHNSPPASYLIDGPLGDNQAVFVKLASHAQRP